MLAPSPRVRASERGSECAGDADGSCARDGDGSQGNPAPRPLPRRYTIRVLACLSARPNSASTDRSAASAASASRLVLHNTTDHPHSAPAPRTRAPPNTDRAGADRRCTARARSPRPAECRPPHGGPPRPESPLLATSRAAASAHGGPRSVPRPPTSTPSAESPRNSWRHPTPPPTVCRPQDSSMSTWSASCCERLGLNDDLGGRLHNAIADRRDRERAKLLTAGLLDEDPARGQRTPTPVL
ncbi:hypothetical protein BH20ACT19_BH20ACT19_08520 [soil metagenome]